MRRNVSSQRNSTKPSEVVFITLAASLTVEKLLDTARGALVNGFVDSMARNAVRRMIISIIQMQQPI
jgi:hypothetical protein